MESRAKAVLITGSNGGLGSALCAAFRSAGFLVVGTDEDPEGEVHCDEYVQMDLSELVASSTREATFLGQVRSFLRASNAGLHALVNNAAVQLVGCLEQIRATDLEHSFRVNVAAPFCLAKVLADELRSTKGAIINIGSIHAKLTKKGFVAYSVSKAGMAGLTRALALEFAEDVTVNTIAPAALDTPMLRAGFANEPEKLADLAAHHPIGRVGKPEEIANIAVFLASNTARFMSGAEISADGAIGVRLHDPA